jgi:hypothetical protein
VWDNIGNDDASGAFVLTTLLSDCWQCSVVTGSWWFVGG